MRRVSVKSASPPLSIALRTCNGASEWPLPSVDAPVLCEIIVTRKGRATTLAGKRLLARVRSRVGKQVKLSLECSAAALVRADEALRGWSAGSARSTPLPDATLGDINEERGAFVVGFVHDRKLKNFSPGDGKPAVVQLMMGVVVSFVRA